MGYHDWLIFVKHISDKEYLSMTEEEQSELFEEFRRS